MAFTPHTIEDIEYLASAMKAASDALASLAKNMKDHEFSPIYLQLSVAKTYADSLYRLCTESEFQFRNQLHAKKTGKPAAFQIRQQKNAFDKAKREALAKANSLGIVKKSTRKKG